MSGTFHRLFSRRSFRSLFSLLLCMTTLLTAASVYKNRPVKAGLPIATTPSGAQVRWQGTVTYSVDQGTLGSLSNAQATALVNEIFGIWQSVPTANLQAQSSGQIAQDVTAANYMSFYRNRGDAVHPIIFDSDGSIIDAIFGVGAHQSTLGFGVPSWSVSSTDTAIDGIITDADALLNGAFIGGRNDTPQISVDQFKATFVHEIGHFLGIGHAQLNLGIANDRNFTNDFLVSIMHPFSIGNGLLTQNGQTQVVLTQDDKAQLSRLYPGGTTASTMGTIRGRVFLPDGTNPFQGANVIARKIDDPLNVAVSSVSGFLYRGTGSNANFGSTNSSWQGYFELNGLPPGNYTVEVEPVYPEFIGGSGVGPYDPPVDLPGHAEYYSGASESNNDGPATATVINVRAGQTIENINIILNSNNTFSQVSESGTHNSVATAQNITLPVMVSGNVSSNETGIASPFPGTQVQDLFAFNAVANEWITIELEWPNPAVNLDLYFYDGTGTRMASSYLCSFGISCGGSFNPTREQIGPIQVPADGKYIVGISSRTASVVNYTVQVTSQRASFQNNAVAVTTVTAASYQSQLSPGSIGAAFGTQLYTAVNPPFVAASTTPLPTALGNVSVTVNGLPAGLFFVSPNQINYEIPSGTAAGTANVVVNANGVISSGAINVASVAPGLFTANADGQGVPAAYILRVKPNGQQIAEPIAERDVTNKFVPKAVQRIPGDLLFLIMFGSGVRNAPNSDGRSDNGVAENVQVTTGGVNSPVLFAGAAPGFVGLDQINIELPAGIAAGQSITVQMKVSNGQSMVQANPVVIALQ